MLGLNILAGGKAGNPLQAQVRLFLPVYASSAADSTCIGCSIAQKAFICHVSWSKQSHLPWSETVGMKLDRMRGTAYSKRASAGTRGQL